MLKTPRLVHLFRQTPAHVQASVGRSFTGQLAKLSSGTTTPLRRDFATSTFRTARPSQYLRSWRVSPFRGGRQARFNSSKTAAEDILNQKNLSLSDRMKQMSRKYGWIVVGIYLSLSVLDFPFCFLAVRWIGTERIAEIEHTVISAFWSAVEKAMPSLKERREEKEALEAAAEEMTKNGEEAGVVNTLQGKNKHEDASTYLLDCIRTSLANSIQQRYLDAAASRLRCAQIPHLLPDPHHPRHHP